MTVKDYDDWLKRAALMPAVLDQAIVNMREGVSKGIVQPRVLMEKVLPQLAANITDDPQKSIFWGPITNMPKDFSGSRSRSPDRGLSHPDHDAAHAGLPASARLHRR